ETKRQLQPLLSAGILPDIILLENEGSDGFLMNDPVTKYARGIVDSKVSLDVVNDERYGLIPTGNIISYPQYAGYLKAEMVACNEIIKEASFSLGTVRYGLHSHGHFSAYPSPATPIDINSDTSILVTLDRLTRALTEI
ncbi:MAG: hypothetical protein L6R41_007048, partial [Letrouitia leprolyta]